MSVRQGGYSRGGEEQGIAQPVVAEANNDGDSAMSDYRDPNEPLWRGQDYEPAARGSDTSWGWIAGALAIVVVVAIAFGVGHGPTRTASNDTSPAARHFPPPPAPRNPMNPALPGLTPPPAPGNTQSQ